MRLVLRYYPFIGVLSEIWVWGALLTLSSSCSSSTKQAQWTHLQVLDNAPVVHVLYYLWFVRVSQRSNNDVFERTGQPYERLPGVGIDF